MDFKAGVLQTFLKIADPGRLPGINHNEAGDLVQGDHFLALKIIGVVRLDQKFPDILFLGTREGKNGIRIEFFYRNHGGHGVEIGIQVGGNNVHDRFIPWGEIADADP